MGAWGIAGRAALAACMAALATSSFGQALPACTPLTFAGGSPEGFTLSGLWHVSTACGANTGLHSVPDVLYYGIDGNCSFDTGVANSGNADSPPIAHFGDSQLRFNHRQDSEDGNPFDQSIVQYSTDGGGSWNTLIPGNQLPRDGEWHGIIADLPVLPVTSVLLRFRFDTIDAVTNSGLGWMVDDIQICRKSELPVPASRPGSLALMAALLALAAFGALRFRRR